MKNAFQSHKPAVILVMLIMAAGAIAWQTRTPGNKNEFRTNGRDTTQPRKYPDRKDEFRLDELDQAMKQLDKEMKRLSEEMKNLKLDKLDIDLQRKLEEVDLDKLKTELKASWKDIDMTKIRKDMDHALKELNAEEWKKEMAMSLKKAEAELKKVELVDIDKEMKKVAEEMKRMEKVDMAEIRRSVEKGMEEAREGMRKAEVELKNLRDFTNELDKDGLIDKKKSYKIELKDGELYINDKKQTKEATEKYQKYYRNKKNFTIRTDGNDTLYI